MASYDYNKTARWTFYTTGVILIAVGIISLMNPSATIFSAAIFMGIGLILTGINELVPYFSMRNNPERPGWLLLLGILDILVGVLLVTRIGLAVFTLLTLVAVWVMFSGLLRIYVSFTLKSAGIEKWWLMLVSGILMAIAAVVLFMNPFVAAYTVVFMIGVTLIGMGVLIIAEGRTIYPALPARKHAAQH